MDGKKVADRDLIKRDEAILGVRLGQFMPGENPILSFDYDLPDDLDGMVLQAEEKIVLRAEIVRRRAQS